MVLLGCHGLSQLVALGDDAAALAPSLGELELLPFLASAWTLQDIDVEISKFGIVEIEVSGTVGVVVEQVGAGPVEYGHEVVADTVGVEFYSKKVVPATQLEDFKAGGIDVISGITGGAETDEAIKLADESDGAYAYIHYSRAGYGKLGFRADYGPAQFTEVRQAIAYCMDRAKFAKDFTGGYGGVVDGPYYTGSWMYKAAVEQGMILDAYATSVDSAIAVLEEAGWVYAADGSDYTEGVRWSRILLK